MAKKVKIGIKVPTSSELNRRYGNLLINPSTQEMPKLWLPSRFLALNYQYGGGIPFGKILEVMGQSSSGKSLIAYDFAYCTQQLGGHVIWVDAEQSWDNSWAEQNGIELDKVTLINSTEIETISDAIADLSILWRSKLTHNEPILIVVDSIAAMDCTENINIKMTDGKAEMGGRAKALYKMFRIRTELLSKLGITQIYINQLRVALNVGFGQDNTTSTGGKALGFYASIRSAFYAGKQVTKKVNGKERKVGKLVSIRPIKNKVAPLRNTIPKAPVYFNQKYVEYVGFDRYHGFADILVEEDVLEKTSGGIYKYKGKTVARGEEKFQSVVEEDDKLRRKLIKVCGINTISVTQSKIDELVEKGINLFPVDGNLDYESQSDDSEDEEEEEEFED